MLTKKTDTIELYENLKEHLIANDNIFFALIFGSYAKAKQGRKSDVDLAIYFKNLPKDIELLYLINELSESVGREIDIVILNNASPFLSHQVIKYGVPLVIRDRYIYTKFREKTMTTYEEYKFVSGMNAYD